MEGKEQVIEPELHIKRNDGEYLREVFRCLVGAYTHDVPLREGTFDRVTFEIPFGPVNWFSSDKTQWIQIVDQYREFSGVAVKDRTSSFYILRFIDYMRVIFWLPDSNLPARFTSISRLARASLQLSVVFGRHFRSLPLTSSGFSARAVPSVWPGRKF